MPCAPRLVCRPDVHAHDVGDAEGGEEKDEDHHIQSGETQGVVGDEVGGFPEEQDDAHEERGGDERAPQLGWAQEPKRRQH